MEITDKEYELLEYYAGTRFGEPSQSKMEVTLPLNDYDITVTFGLN